MAIIDDGIYAVRGGNMYKIIVPEPQFPGAKTVKIRLKPETNADRIRAMTDEELSYYLDGLAGDGCPPQMVCNKERYKCNVRKCWLEWLKQEAVDNGACLANETSEKVQEKECTKL